MKKTIIITDLTQMEDGNRVCIAGIDESGRCIRPVTEPREKGVPEDWLFSGNQLIIRPGARVEFDFYSVANEPPHIEDKGFNPQHIISKGFCRTTEWERILSTTSNDEVNSAYDNFLNNNKWVRPGSQTKSLVTLRQLKLLEVYIKGWRYKLRLGFSDGAGDRFDCAVSDRALWNLCYSLITKQGLSQEETTERILELIRDAKRTYLRLGLARPWAPPGTSELRCYLQVTGVYTFPDYLQGKSFADL